MDFVNKPAKPPRMRSGPVDKPVDGVDNYVPAPGSDPVLLAAATHGVLPLTSVCDLHCVFCSHGGNPSGVRAERRPALALDRLPNLLPFLREAPRITIGQSATRINEGEPLLHPNWREILTTLRRSFPQKPIGLTTSGSRLYREDLAFLRELGGIELHLSLQSLDNRRVLLGCSRSGREILELVAGSGLPFTGSLVGVAAAGAEDLAVTVWALAAAGASAVHLYRPGFTDRTPLADRPPPGWEERLAEMAAELHRQLPTPLLFEPRPLGDLRVALEGVRPKGPAAGAGLHVGDEIMTIDDRPVFSRTEAFFDLRRLGSPRLRLRRGPSHLEITLIKAAGSEPGVILRDDLTRREADRLLGWLASDPCGSLVLSSPLASPMLRDLLRREGLPPEQVVTVRSRLFGGNIETAGLLTVTDFVAALHGRRPRQLLLPRSPFDERGRDLIGHSYLDLAQAVGAEVRLVER